jgi:hypothetical protein
MMAWTRYTLETSSGSATTCAWHLGDLTFQAYSANVFKPFKGGSCGCRGQRCEGAAAGLECMEDIERQATSIIASRVHSVCSRLEEVVVPFGGEPGIAQQAPGGLLLLDSVVNSISSRAAAASCFGWVRRRWGVSGDGLAQFAQTDYTLFRHAEATSRSV